MASEGKSLGRLLVAALLLAAVVACSGLTRDAPVGTKHAPLDVPQSWQKARLAPGHDVHVTEQGIGCDECHALASTQFQDPGPLPCVKCHAREGRIKHASAGAEAAFGASAQSSCTDCHEFAAAESDASAATGAWDCGRCHAGHVSQAPGSVGAELAHRGAPCRACHTPHGEAVAKAQDCASCHAAIHSTHGRVERSGGAVAVAEQPPERAVAAECQVCHQLMHAAASAAVGSCTACHAGAAPAVPKEALFSGGHERCIDCHVPHDFSVQGVVACSACHHNPPALAAAKVPAHAQCVSCHQPHAARADAGGACATCHQKLATDHPAAAGLSACTTCHVPHPSAAERALPLATSVLGRCASCHDSPGHEHGSHAPRVTCIQCHGPHKLKLLAQDHAVCEKCHAPQIQATQRLGAGHAKCVQCHQGLPHDTHVAARPCATCHQAQGSAARAGHQKCEGCHEPHAGVMQQACRSCHAREAASAPQGHAVCTQCHDAHSGKREVQSCSTCHESKSSAPHGNIQGGCQTCHSAHGPNAKTPPTCTSCHERSSFKDLHAQSEHARCQDCHQSHVKQPRPEAETCRSCHRDREAHFPEAQRCSGCHLFKPM